MSTTPSLQALRTRWTTLYSSTLPSLALARDPVQPHWPVTLNHCFARIILDNAVGINRPWPEAVKAPAVKNMSTGQLIDAIELGEMIATGQRDLRELDERSLQFRGKDLALKRKREIMDLIEAIEEEGYDDGWEEESAPRRKAPLPAKKKVQVDAIAELWAHGSAVMRKDREERAAAIQARISRGETAAEAEENERAAAMVTGRQLAKDLTAKRRAQNAYLKTLKDPVVNEGTSVDHIGQGTSVNPGNETVGTEEEATRSVEEGRGGRPRPPMPPSAQRRGQMVSTEEDRARLRAIMAMGPEESQERHAAVSEGVAQGDSYTEAFESERQLSLVREREEWAAAIQQRMFSGETLSEAEDGEREVQRLKINEWAKANNARQKAMKEYLKSVASDEDVEKERRRAEARKKKSNVKKSEMADVWAKFMADKSGQRENTTTDDAEAIAAVCERIASDTSLSLYRRNVLTLLTQVPRGRWTTYKALSAAMHTLSQATNYKLSVSPGSILRDLPEYRGVSTSCARSVGSAMRNNPFAPLAPCHRVLAADRKIGGFGGDWGEEGRFANEKMKLLSEEGVRFDGRGKVVGEPFEDFYAP